MYKIDLYPVQQFMVAAGQIKAELPGSCRTVPSVSTAIKTLDFIASELQELRDALIQYQAAPSPAQLVEVAKELADVLYTAGNVAVALNLPIGEVFEAVADSNTSKFDTCSCQDGCATCHHTGLLNLAREGFKVPKGPNYKPANDDILTILQRHRRVQY